MNFSLTPEFYKQINGELSSLLADTSARCILLSDSVGNVLIKLGDLGGLPTEAITSLLCGGIATLLEAGRNFDDNDVINLAYREGKLSDLYAINIRDNWVLIIVIDRGQMSPRLGTVWFYARKTVVQVNALLEKAPQEQLPVKFDTSVDEAYNDELDKLFG